MTTRSAGMLAVMALLVAACSGSVETTSTTTGTSSHGGAGGTMQAGTGGAMQGGTGGVGTGGVGTGGAAPLPCEQDPGWDMPLDDFQCTLPSPCPEPHFYFGTDPNKPGSTEPHFDDPAAATCILQKLRDREIATLGFASTPKDDFIGQDTYSESIFVLDAEHGASSSVQYADLSKKKSRKNRQILQPAAYFDACLAETDPTKIYDCIIGWSAGCADVDVPCPSN